MQISIFKRTSRKFKRELENFILRKAKFSFESTIYYKFANTAFSREQNAVLAGRRQFYSSMSATGKTRSLLRRNIHRLEKGLIMRPRRDVFGLDYIGETMQKYACEAERFQSSNEIPDPEFQWSRDVLAKYFHVTAADPGIDPHREKYIQVESVLQATTGAGTRIPYQQGLRRATSISYEEYLALCTQRKSVRWFLDKPVPREKILKVLEAARFSPSACNRYPFFFHVFDEKEKVDVVSRLPGGTVGFAENFPVIIAIIGELRNYYGERDRHLIYIDSSLAAMSAVLAAETLGLATCCINWPDIEEAERRAEQVLRLEPDQRPVMFMALGYPDPEGKVAYSQKKPIEEICRFNSELESTSTLQK